VNLISRVNDHPQSGWLGFPAIGRKDKSTSVLYSGCKKNVPLFERFYESRYNRCGCNPPQADLKTTNHLLFLQTIKIYSNLLNID